MDESGQRYVSTEFKLECIYIVCKVIYLRDLDDLEFYRLSDERVRQNVPSINMWEFDRGGGGENRSFIRFRILKTFINKTN